MSERRVPLFIANRPEQTNDELVVRDKYRGHVVARVALAHAPQIERAIEAAHRAAPRMRTMPPFARQQVLEHCVRRFRERSDELVHTLVVEVGKPIRDARGEVSRVIDTFRVAAEESVRIGGEVLNLEISPRSAGYRGFTKRVPVGPCSLVTAFNFPLNIPAHKVAPAIAAGCPFVLKPSERTPLSALLLGEILAEADLPGGAFSILPSALDEVAPLVEDPRLKLLSFTGSGKVGWDLKKRAGEKKVVLELGGNAACIVDAGQEEKLDAIVERLVFGAFYVSGQSCISVQRIIVHESLYEPLRRLFVERTEALVIGDPSAESTFLGPMIDEAAAIRCEQWIRRAESRGARVLCGGVRHGAMHAATVLEGVPRDEPLYCEEVFGPVAVLERVATFEEALRRANDSAYGLQTGVFTADLSHAMKAWDELEVGGVVVGDVPSFRVDNMPYGGVKRSGIGREGVRYAIEDMTDLRLMVLKG